MFSEEQARQAVEHYTDPILRLSYSYLKNTADAQDVCQTVLMKLLTEPRQFSSPEHEKAWVLRTAANACKDILKSPWHRRRCDPEHCAEPTAPAAPDSEVLEAVNALPTKYRTVIYLHYYEGYPAKEIAAILNISQNAVYTRLARARQKLKWTLEEDQTYEGSI